MQDLLVFDRQKKVIQTKHVFKNKPLACGTDRNPEQNTAHHELN